eukprot:scaffold131745_cov48-Prasinocladus_malaysianus.AAC.1
MTGHTYETAGHAAAVAAAVSNPTRTRGKAKIKTKLRYPLVTFNRLPAYLRDNEFVTGVLRLACSLSDCELTDANLPRHVLYAAYGIITELLIWARCSNEQRLHCSLHRRPAE